MYDLTKEQKISLCGSVDLLAAIFGQDREWLRSKYGLPSPYPHCMNCGNRLSAKRSIKSGFCSQKCRNLYAHIQVSCSECGTLFDCVQSRVIISTRRGYKRIFCSQRCLGKFAGRNYGFGAHPPKRKYSDKKD